MNGLTQKELFLRHQAQTSATPVGIDIERAEGVYLFSPDGKAYIDLISGISVSNVGHGNPVVVRAVQDQAARHMHLMVYGEYIQGPQVMLATKLASLLPAGLSSSYFVNSGSEAVEGALKLARKFTGRYHSVSLRGAYHGSTLGALSLMGDEYFRNAYRPLVPGNTLIDPNDIDALDRIDEQTACVFVEPVMGEAGIRVLDTEYLNEVRKRCNDAGALLVFDEIQSGFGRTGDMFAMDGLGITPDIVCLAKGMGGGMPIGAFCSRPEIMACLGHDPILGHITTFGGHPVSCAAALASINVIEQEQLSSRARSLEALFREELSKADGITDIRSKGMLMAVELGDTNRNMRLIELLREEGVLSDWFLFCDTAFRIAPPLTMTDDEALQACGIIHKALRRL